MMDLTFDVAVAVSAQMGVFEETRALSSASLLYQ